MPEKFIFKTDSRRRHAALRINRAGELEFLAPAGFPLSAAQKLVSESTNVISKLRKKFEAAVLPAAALSDGAQLYYMDRRVPLKFSRRGCAVLEDGIYVPEGSSEEIKRKLAILYRREAERYLIPRLYELAEQHGISVKGVTVGSASTRWGSCSSKGNLSFNCLLMLMPPHVRDYVVAHELCHRKHMNHSPAFWAAVAQVFPDYKRAKSWLKETNDLFDFESKELETNSFTLTNDCKNSYLLSIKDSLN